MLKFLLEREENKIMEIEERQYKGLLYKIEALKESISKLNTRYEEQDADRRVQITFLQEDLEDANQQLEHERNQRIALEQANEEHEHAALERSESD